jgi:PAS domain S-box-containing protein
MSATDTADDLADTRANLELALRHNEALLRTLDLHSKVSVTDCSGSIIEVNDNFCRISGYSREELLGQPHSIVNSGMQGQQFWRDMWHTIAGGQSWRGEICNRSKDGSLHWVDSIIVPFVGTEGLVEKYVSIRTDITAAKLTERRLRASEEFLDRTGRIAGIGGWQFDIATRHISWSAHMHRIHETEFDYCPTLEEGLAFYSPQSRPAIEQAIAEAKLTGAGWDLELQMQTYTGRKIWVRSVCTVECTGGRPTRLVGSTQDITASKQTEKSLAYERDLMASLLEALPDQIFFKDSDGKYLRVNRGMALRHGLKSAAEAVGKSEADYFPQAHASQSAEIEQQIMDSGEPVFEMERQTIWPDTAPTWSLSTKMPLYDTDDRIVGTFGISRDITKRKAIEAQLLETSTRLTIAADSAGIGVWEFDLAGNSLHWDDWMYRIYGVERKPGVEEPYSTWANCLHPEDRERCEGEIAAALRGEKEFESEFRIVRPGGEIRYLKASSRTRRSSDGIVERMTGVNIDVTDLTEATHKAEHANRAKSQFLANMSHEIRTPMNAVIGLSYLMAQTDLGPEQSGYLEKIQASSNLLLAVINDVLDLTKIEASELIVERIPFSPYSLLRGLSDVIALEASAKGIAFDIEVSEELPIALQGDATRLGQILTNLLANAVKFTDKGAVTLRVSLLKQTSSSATLCFVVSDTGIGITPEAQARLFMPFAQADASITRRFGGTGLGLSIVKSLVSLLGGEVRLESTPGAGSQFTVALEFLLAAPDALYMHRPYAATPMEHALEGVRVLVVDDSVINLEVTESILELHGAQVWLAANGLKAVECLQEHPYDFDVVLMDVQMPVLDGYQATRRIRSELGLVDLPIIALTAGALSSERQQAVEAGMDDFIVKPFDARTLVGNIQRHVHISHRHAPTPIDTELQQRSPAAAIWPEIDGIDSTDARLRLCDDFGLFRTNLKRLLDEFSDVSLGVVSENINALELHAARMHKLSGSSGTLGANAIQQLAVDVRAACVAHDIKHAERLAAALAEQLKRLRQSAAPIFATARADAARADQDAQDALPRDLALDPRQLAELIGLACQGSLSVLQRFAAVAPHLRRHLGAEAFATLRDNIDNLRFDAALTALLQVQSSLAGTAGSPPSVSRSVSNNNEIGNGFSSSEISGSIIP